MSTRTRWNLALTLALRRPLALRGAAAFRPALSAQQAGVPNAQSDEEVARKSAAA